MFCNKGVTNILYKNKKKERLVVANKYILCYKEASINKIGTEDEINK